MNIYIHSRVHLPSTIYIRKNFPFFFFYLQKS
nr:MAG TPA: hypothetical protein [Caudoviricetes sp.]